MLILLLACFASLHSAVLAATTITTFSNTDCTQEILVVNPPETRECQTNTLGNFSSFQITDPSPSCNVSWHGSDSSKCASDYMGQLQINFCYNNLTFFAEFSLVEFLGAKFPITEFTVDCNDSVFGTALGGLPASSSVLTGTVPTAVGGSSATSTSSPASGKGTSKGGGLSGWPLVGTIIGAIVGIAAIVSGAFGIYFSCGACRDRRRDQHREDTRLEMEIRRDEIPAEERARRAGEDQARQNIPTHVDQAADNNRGGDPAANNTANVNQTAASVPAG